MPSLLLPDETKQTVIGALFTVCRVDGRVSPVEMEVLRAAAADLAPDLPIDDEWLLMSEVTPEDLVRQLHATRADPFRGLPVSSLHDVGTALVPVAVRVCSSGRPLSIGEARMIRRFGRALGLTPRELDALGALHPYDEPPEGD